MNTLDDLRATLDREAATVHESATSARATAVRGRARAVRRRRTAAGAVTAALVVGGASAVLLLPGGEGSAPTPADRALGSFEAPASMQALGATYAFEEGVGGQDRVRLTVPDSGAPTLVTWATESGTARVDFRNDGASDRREAPADFTDYTVLSGGGPGTVVVRGDGEVAVALYRYDVPPEGDTAEGLTWRDHVGDATRLGSVHGRPGRTEVTLTVPVDPRGGVLHFKDYCLAPQDGWTQVVEIDGEVSSVGACGLSEIDRGDPPAGSVSFPERTTWGGTVTVRAYVVKGRDRGRMPDDGARAAASAPGVRVGAAVYESGEPATRVPGWDVPTVVEHDGHLWQFTGVAAGSPDGGPAEARLPAGADQVLVSAYSHQRGQGGTVRILHNDRNLMQMSAGGASEAALVATGGDTVTLRNHRGTSELALATYERVD